jgi:sn-glycerol 3-phosphate transport system permease protein
MPALPLVLLIIAALVGAGVIAFVFVRAGRAMTSRDLLIGGLIGGAAGALGSMMFLAPLNYCTFEPERKPIDVAVGIALAAIGAGIALLAVRWLLLRMRSRGPVFNVGTQPGAFKGTLTPLLLLAPTLIILLLFLYYPAVDTFRLSVSLALFGGKRQPFICVDNFTALINPAYGKSVLITLGMSLAIVVIGLALSLLIATAAYQPVRGARLYRTLLIWPYAISPVVAGVIFSIIFAPVGGIFNHVWEGIFGVSIPWLNDPNYAPWAVIIASVWKSLGFNILFYIAGLQNVPKDLLEAAAIDGANLLQRFRRVTVPLLSPITFFLIVTNMTYAFFETVGTLIYMTGGSGPLDSTNTMMYRIYQTGVQNRDLGSAAAQAIVLFGLVIGLTILQFRTTGERVQYGA